MAALAVVDVTVGDKTERVNVLRLDMVMLERQTGRGINDNMPATALFQLAWQACRRLGWAVPDTFDAFLELGPDVVEVVDEKETLGKDSGNGPNISGSQE